MGIPKYKEPAPDPAMQMLEEQAKQQNIEALEARTQADTAAMMARYGTRLALAGTTGGAAASAMMNSVTGSPLLMRQGAG